MTAAIQGLVRVQRAERFDLDTPGIVCEARSVRVTVTIVNLSRSGCLFRGDAAPAIGETISIGIPRVGARSARIVRAGPDGIGCAFLDLLSETELTQALAVAMPDERDAASTVRALRRSSRSAETSALEPQRRRSRNWLRR